MSLDVGLSANPIPTKQVDYAHHITAWIQKFQYISAEPTLF
jgi:hypothetical protein